MQVNEKIEIRTHEDLDNFIERIRKDPRHWCVEATYLFFPIEGEYSGKAIKEYLMKPFIVSPSTLEGYSFNMGTLYPELWEKGYEPDCFEVMIGGGKDKGEMFLFHDYSVYDEGLPNKFVLTDNDIHIDRSNELYTIEFYNMCCTILDMIHILGKVEK